MWATILSLIGTAASGAMSAINNRRMESAQNSEAARQEAHYQAEKSRDPMMRADNAAIMGTLDRRLDKQNEVAAAKGRIMGSTPEVAVAQQKANAEAYANAASSIAANNQQRVDKAEEGLEKARENAAKNKLDQMAARNATYQALWENAANAAGGFFGDDGPNYQQRIDARQQRQATRNADKVTRQIMKSIRKG